MKRFHRILVATDFTGGSKLAVEEAVEMARESHAELLIAHAYASPNVTQADSIAAGVFEEWDENLRAQVAKELEPLVESARRRLVFARALPLRGVPSRAIAAAVEENGVGLVVIGTRGRSRFARFFLGSVATRIISTAPCPVMTVRAAAPNYRRAKPAVVVREFRTSRPSRSVR
jgi:universal stress protein A